MFKSPTLKYGKYTCSSPLEQEKILNNQHCCGASAVLLQCCFQISIIASLVVQLLTQARGMEAAGVVKVNNEQIRVARFIVEYKQYYIEHILQIDMDHPDILISGACIYISTL